MTPWVYPVKSPTYSHFMLEVIVKVDWCIKVDMQPCVMNLQIFGLWTLKGNQGALHFASAHWAIFLLQETILLATCAHQLGRGEDVLSLVRSLQTLVLTTMQMNLSSLNEEQKDNDKNEYELLLTNERHNDNLDEDENIKLQISKT